MISIWKAALSDYATSILSWMYVLVYGLSLSRLFLLLLSPLFPYMGALWVMSVAFVLVPSSRFRSKSKGSFYSGLKDQGFVLVKDKT